MVVYYFSRALRFSWKSFHQIHKGFHHSFCTAAQEFHGMEVPFTQLNKIILWGPKHTRSSVLERGVGEWSPWTLILRADSPSKTPLQFIPCNTSAPQSPALVQVPAPCRVQGHSSLPPPCPSPPVLHAPAREVIPDPAKNLSWLLRTQPGPLSQP